MTDQETEFRTKLRALVGQPTGGTGKPSVAPDPVNQAMIRHWAYALADMNPVYLDPEFAAESRFGDIVSPPVMLQTWTMPTPKIRGSQNEAARRSRAPAVLGFPRRGRIHQHVGVELRVRDRALSPTR